VERLPESASFADVAAVIESWNRDPAVHGFIVQLPLPRGIDAHAVLKLVSPDKDVDGLSPASLGALAAGRPGFMPATPSGIIELLLRNGITIPGKRVVIVGRGELVGKPLANMLLLRGERGDATVTVCHSRTQDLSAVCRTAEILVVAAGRARLVTGEMVSEGVVVVDAGTNSVAGKLVGDVDFETVAAKASAITPVPGGVGPMTVAMLLANTVKAAEQRVKIEE
jgi:methylenetetrahydrofolate dehydrogenase (NADP+)/methenyltetrahydrofolate cyclohydrolase